MVQAPQFDGLSLDPLSLQQNGLAAPEVDVGGREIVEALVIAPMIVVLDEGCDLGFEIAWQEVVFEQDAVLHRLVPAFDLALGLGVAGRSAGMLQVFLREPIGQAAGDVTRAVVGKQPPPLHEPELSHPDAASAMLTVSVTF